MAVNQLQNTEQLPQKDAVIIRGEKGRFLPGTIAPGTIKTSADARSMAEKRWEKARKATASRIMQEAQSIDPTVQTEYDAHALMYAMQYVKLADADKPNVDDAEKIAQAMGTAPRRADLVQAQQPTLSAPQGDDIVMLIMRRRLADVVEGDVIDIRNDLPDNTE